MKKIILSIVFILGAFAMNAQHTDTRFGVAPNYDNTYRTLTLQSVGYTFVAGPDTLKLTPNAFETIVNVGAMVDSLQIQFKNIKSSWVGDKVRVIGYGSGASRKLNFVAGTNMSVGVTLTAASTKYISIQFIFDGIKWVEISRFTQP